MSIFDVVKKPVSKILKYSSPGSMALFEAMERSQTKRKMVHGVIKKGLK